MEGGINLFTYVAGNPVNQIDPEGLSFTGALRGGVKGAVLGAGIGAVLGGSIGLVAGSPTGPGALLSAGAGAAAGAYEGALIGALYGSIRGALDLDDDAKPISQFTRHRSSCLTIDDIRNKPPTHPDYIPPKNWDGKKVRNPNGPGSGYPDRNGDVWVPTDHKGTHAPHWDVQNPRTGGHVPKYPR